MHYLIYLAGMFLLLIGAACCDFTTFHFIPSQLNNYIDLRSFVFILAPCLLVLFSTKSFAHFGRAFPLMFGKKSAGTRDSAHAIQAVMITAWIAGAAHAIIVVIQELRNMNLSAEVGSSLGNTVLVALLSLLYPLILCIILLPVLLAIWKYERTGTVVPLKKVKNKK